MRTYLGWFSLFTLLLTLSVPAHADGLLMARSERLFPEAMATLQSAITSRGYTVTRLQEVNENLAKRDFKSDMYRVVYFGKYQEIKTVTEKYPKLIPFLPLNITIFAEGDQAILVASHPRALQLAFPSPDLKPLFERWEQDMLAIMDEVRVSK